jgi:hypothetical protein
VLSSSLPALASSTSLLSSTTVKSSGQTVLMLSVKDLTVSESFLLVSARTSFSATNAVFTVSACAVASSTAFLTSDSITVALNDSISSG